MIAYNIIFSVLYCFCILKADSFLQLNGYKADKNFFKYYKTDFSAVAFVFFAVSLLCYFVFNSVWLYVHAVLTIALAVKYLTEKKKTPLRFTPRVKRLLVTQWIFLLAVAFAFNPAVFLLLPFVVLCANAVNAPMEICIKAKFRERAKIKLKEHSGLKIIAITGSYGKTSVKNILYDILSVKYNVVKTPSSFNTPMGIVKTINETDLDGVDFFICEMGARHKGDIAELCYIATPDVAVITGIAPQHMETFGSIENVIATKFEIVQNAKQDAAVFINGDCDYLQNLPQIARQVIVSGENAEVSYDDVSCDKDGSVFVVKTNGKEFKCKTKLLGRHNVSNLCLCIAIALFLGFSDEEIIAGVDGVDYAPHRLQLIKGANGVFILDDSYNANIRGVEESFKVLRCFEGQKFVIASGIVDAGKETESLNRQIGLLMAKSCDYAMLVGLNSNYIQAGLTEGGFDKDKIFLCADIDDAVKKIGGFSRTGDVILFSNDLPDNYSK